MKEPSKMFKKLQKSVIRKGAVRAARHCHKHQLGWKKIVPSINWAGRTLFQA